MPRLRRSNATKTLDSRPARPEVHPQQHGSVKASRVSNASIKHAVDAGSAACLQMREARRLEEEAEQQAEQKAEAEKLQAMELTAQQEKLEAKRAAKQRKDGKSVFRNVVLTVVDRAEQSLKRKRADEAQAREDEKQQIALEGQQQEAARDSGFKCFASLLYLADTEKQRNAKKRRLEQDEIDMIKDAPPEIELLQRVLIVEEEQQRQLAQLYSRRRAPVAGPVPLRRPGDNRNIRNSNRDILRSKLRNRYLGQPMPPSFLHMLPGELRNMVYAEVHKVNGTLRIPVGLIQQPTLPIAMPDLAQEVYSWFFGSVRCEIDVFSKFLERGYLAWPRYVHLTDGTFRIGRLAIEAGHWFRQPLPFSQTLGRVSLVIREEDLSEVCSVSIWAYPHAPVEKIKLRHGKLTATMKSRLSHSIAEAKRLAHSLRERPGFTGFTLQDLESFARAYADPEHRL